jgi:hypothetical protein
VKTCQKIVEGQLKKLRERASHLPRAERERLCDELRAWWLTERKEMDAFCEADSPQSDESTRLGQLVHHPPDDEPAEREPCAEDLAMWNRLEERVGAPPIQSVEIALRPPAPVPRSLTYEPDDEMTVEELEAEAVRAEACGERAPWHE